MEQFIKTLLTLLVSFTPYYTDQETVEERKERMTVVSTAITHACYRATCTPPYDEDCDVIFSGKLEECVVGEATLGYFESRFAKHIHENKCRKGYWSKKQNKWIRGECDEQVSRDVHGKVVAQFFTSFTMWQMKRTEIVLPEWPHMHGSSLEATKLAAWASTKIFSRCWSGNARKAFVCYAGSSNPNWPGALPRVKFYDARLKELEQLMININISSSSSEMVAQND